MVSRETFEQFVAEGVEEIPEVFRAKLKNVAFLVEDEPSPEVRAIEGLAEDETLLGYYHGVPNTARGSEYGVGPTLPDTITIYQKPIEEMALQQVQDEHLQQGQGKRLEQARDADREALEREIREIVVDTVYHEVAHYLGYDEDGVAERERLRHERLRARKDENTHAS